MSGRRAQDQFIVRFPDGMRDRIAEAARASNRSMNAEIVARLEESFQPAEADGRLSAAARVAALEAMSFMLLYSIAQFEQEGAPKEKVIERLKDELVNLEMKKLEAKRDRPTPD